MDKFWSFFLVLFLIKANDAMTTKAVCAGGILKMYADGVLIGTHDASTSDYGTFSHDDNTDVIGFECETSASMAGIIADIGSTYITDGTWRCSNTLESGWTDTEFEDITWPVSTTVADNSVSSAISSIGDIASDAKWIWTSAYQFGDTTVYCRGSTQDNGPPDNAGRHFILGFMSNENWPDGEPLIDVELYVGTSSTSEISVRITSPSNPSSGLNQAFTVTRGQVQQVIIPSALIVNNTEASAKAIEVTATQEVVVYGVNKQRYSNDAFLALPVDAIGVEFYLVTWDHQDSPYQNALIVGVHDATTVTVTLPSTLTTNVLLPDGSSQSPGATFSIALNKYDTYGFYATEDMTGTHVLADKDIVMYSGNQRTTLTWPYEDSSKDHLVEHLTDISRWGTKFILTPVPTRTSGDEYKIIAAEADTEIIIRDGDTIIETINITEAGGFVSFHASAGLVQTVVADKGIMVVQYQKSMVDSSEPGDPAMQIIPPVALFVPDVTFATPQSATSTYVNYITVLIQDSYKDGLLYNDQQIDTSLFTTVDQSATYLDYEYAIATFQIASTGVHSITHNSTSVNFGAYLSGFGEFETYATGAGYRLTPINQVCVAFTGPDGDGYDNDCDGLIDEDDCTSVQGTDCARPPPVDGDWSQWSEWGPCLDCDVVSTQVRTRSCSDPVPMYNGQACSTDIMGSLDTQSCTVDCSEYDGTYSDWSTWSECDDTTCLQDRSRICERPWPQLGNDCVGNSTENAACEDCGNDEDKDNSSESFTDYVSPDNPFTFIAVVVGAAVLTALAVAACFLIAAKRRKRSKEEEEKKKLDESQDSQVSHESENQARNSPNFDGWLRDTWESDLGRRPESVTVAWI